MDKEIETQRGSATCPRSKWAQEAQTKALSILSLRLWASHRAFPASVIFKMGMIPASPRGPGSSLSAVAQTKFQCWVVSFSIFFFLLCLHSDTFLFMRYIANFWGGGGITFHLCKALRPVVGTSSKEGAEGWGKGIRRCLMQEFLSPGSKSW